MDCFVSHIKWIISGFVDSSHQTLTLRTTIQHYIGRHNTTTAQTTTTSKIVHLPEDYWDCTILYHPFIEMSQIGDGICDNFLNHVYCHFDGGDCSLQDINTSVCSICTCFDDISCKCLLCKVLSILFEWFQFK